MKNTFDNIEIPDWVLKTIADRIGELVKYPPIGKELARKHKEGMTVEECRRWITDLAIATLYGLPV